MGEQRQAFSVPLRALREQREGNHKTNCSERAGEALPAKLSLSLFSNAHAQGSSLAGCLP
jgi:hypothetical protein